MSKPIYVLVIGKRKTEELEKLNWWRYADIKTILGTSIKPKDSVEGNEL